LPGLGEQDQRRSVRRLQAESEVEEDEGVKVEMRETDDVDGHPEPHDDRLGHQEGRRTEKPCEALGLDGKPVVAEDRGEMRVLQVKSQGMAGASGCLAGRGNGHEAATVFVLLSGRTAAARFRWAREARLPVGGDRVDDACGSFMETRWRRRAVRSCWGWCVLVPVLLATLLAVGAAK